MARGQSTFTITATPTSDLKTNFNFALSAANVTAGFFDQYRIEAIRFTVAPQNNAIGLVTNSTTTLSPFYCVIDYDDSTSLANVSAALAYSTCVVANPGESIERVFKPRIAVAGYTGGFTGFTNMADQWIDSASTTVLHYGVKTLVSGVAAAQTLLQSWDVTVEYFINFRKAI
jgi:hypothetical protein